ncbi:MAG: gliding motility-associated C-terminal domain-containing protein [Flavobacteriales bacterium]
MQVQLDASAGKTYDWQPSKGLSCTDCQDPVAHIDRFQAYQVRIDRGEGCVYKEEFVIRIPLRIPNVFTPNGDGTNDRFHIRGLPPSSSLRIFNRWGQKVFEGRGRVNDWDGRNPAGKAVPQGTYHYTLNSPYLKDKQKGELLLSR